MTWRSIVVTKNSYLKYRQQQLVIRQDDNEFNIPIEDIAVLVIDSLEVTLTSKLLSACAANKIIVIFIDETHIPNSLLMPYMCHSRQLKTINLQLSATKPIKKRAWQALVTSKLTNQANTLRAVDKIKQANHIERLAAKVKSGDPDNLEAQAAQQYFPALYPNKLLRSQERFYNAAMNYGYAIVRSAIARNLVIYGFLPIWGVHHKSQLNAFNLADDLLEPFRAFVDFWVITNWPKEPEEKLDASHKAKLINILTFEVKMREEKTSILNATSYITKSLVQCYKHTNTKYLTVPVFICEPD